MKTFLFVCVLALLVPPATAGCGLGLFMNIRDCWHMVMDSVNQLLPKLAAGYEQEFKFTMQQLDAVIPEVEKQLTPFLQQIGGGLLEGERQMSSDIAGKVMGVITQTNLEFSAMGLAAAVVLQLMIDHTINEIKNKIIDEIADRLQKLQEYFFANLNQILYEIWLGIAKIDCSVKGDIARIYQDKYKLDGKDCMTYDSTGCCAQVHAEGRNLTTLGDSQLYNLQICRHLSRLAPDTPIKTVQEVYMDASVAAKTFFCIDNDVGPSSDFFTKEYDHWATQYWFWENMKNDATLNGCATPADCYHSAVLRLNHTSNAELALKADISLVQPLFGQMRNELKLTFPVVNKTNHTQDPRPPCPAGWGQWGMLGVSTHPHDPVFPGTEYYRACEIADAKPAMPPPPPGLGPHQPGMGPHRPGPAAAGEEEARRSPRDTALASKTLRRLIDAAYSAARPFALRSGNGTCAVDPVDCYRQAIQQIALAKDYIERKADALTARRRLSEHEGEMKLVNASGCPRGWAQVQNLTMDTRHPEGKHIVLVCHAGPHMGALPAPVLPPPFLQLPPRTHAVPSPDAVLADAAQILTATKLAVVNLADAALLQAVDVMEADTFRFFNSTDCPVGWVKLQSKSSQVKLVGKGNHLDVLACHKPPLPTPSPTPAPSITL